MLCTPGAPSIHQGRSSSTGGVLCVDLADQRLEFGFDVSAGNRQLMIISRGAL